MVNTYGLGSTAILIGRFKDGKTGALSDPTAVFLTVWAPTGTPTIYQYGVDSEVTKDGTGEYRGEIPVDTAGDWYYRWTSTGTAKAGKERTKFRVRL